MKIKIWLLEELPLTPIEREMFVRIYNPPLSKLSIRLYKPNLGVIYLLLGPLVPLVPVGLMGPHVLVTRVWGTLIEAK